MPLPADGEPVGGADKLSCPLHLDQFFLLQVLDRFIDHGNRELHARGYIRQNEFSHGQDVFQDEIDEER